MKKRSRTIFTPTTTPLNERGSIAIPHLPHTGLHSEDAALYSTGVIRRLTLATVVSGIGLFQMLSLGFMLGAITPSNATFNYTSDTVCASQYSLLPSLQPSAVSESFDLTHKGGVAIGSNKLFTTSICADAHSAPSGESQEILKHSPTSLPYLHSDFIITSGELPKIDTTPDASLPIATTSTMNFELEKPDAFFSYMLIGNGSTANCTTDSTQVSCPTDSLGLEQSKEYELSLARTYNDITLSPASFQGTFKTVSAVKVTDSSIKNTQKLFTKPQSMTLTFDKALSAAEAVSLTELPAENATPIKITQSIEGSTLTVNWESELEREKEFILEVNSITAVDKAVLEKPYILRFSTSAGPTVASSSLASYGERFSPDFTVSFDYAVENTDLSSFIQLTSNNQPVSFDYSLSGSTLRIFTTQPLNRCQPFVVGIKAGISNIHGVGGGEAWSRESRTLCQSISTIGSSTEGRAISAYRFGTGGQTILFVGGTHGNEASSVTTLNSWVDALEAQYARIPSNLTVVVVPNINPDAYAKGDRKNANDVDLNRNFPANNWKKDVTLPGGELAIDGGGTEPLSEVESKIIADYTLSLSPKLVLTYHARGSLAIANESGNSLAKASEYGALSGFSVLGNSGLGNTFNYDTTGAYEDWLHDKHNIPALLIELRTNTNNEFTQQESAMWKMLE